MTDLYAGRFWQSASEKDAELYADPTARLHEIRVTTVNSIK